MDRLIKSDFIFKGMVDDFRKKPNFKLLDQIIGRKFQNIRLEKSITVEARGIDYYNLIDSTWDYAGKPEKYNGTYTIGKVPKNKRNKVLTTGVKRQKGNGGY